MGKQQSKRHGTSLKGRQLLRQKRDDTAPHGGTNRSGRLSEPWVATAVSLIVGIAFLLVQADGVLAVLNWRVSATCWLIIICATVAIVSRHSGATPRHYVGAAAALILLGALSVVIRFKGDHQRPFQTVRLLINPPDVAVLVTCDMQGLPITVPPHSFTRAVAVNQRIFRSGSNWGVFEFHNDSDSSQLWPNKSVIRKVKAEGDWRSLMSVACKVSNEGTANIVDLAVPLKFWFGDGPGGDKNAVRYTLTVSPLDAGKTENVYLVNDCPMTATAVVQSQGRALIAGEDKWQAVRVNFPERSPIDPVLTWFPATIPIIQSSPCS